MCLEAKPLLQNRLPHHSKSMLINNVMNNCVYKECFDEVDTKEGRGVVDKQKEMHFSSFDNDKYKAACKVQ